MNSEIIVFGLDKLDLTSKRLSKELEECQIVTFTGPLGAGKTTFVRELLKLWGVDDEIVSPTFNYVNIYKNFEGKTFYHFDLYRIKNLGDFLNLGFDEYLHDSNSMSLIEWPEIIEPILGEKFCAINIDYDENSNERILKIQKKF